MQVLKLLEPDCVTLVNENSQLLSEFSLSADRSHATVLVNLNKKSKM